MPSKFSLHKSRWVDGCGSDACLRASKVCLGKGQLPCDVLMIGEAPGPSENMLGTVFVGPAGQLLDRIIKDALSGLEQPVRVALTNLVGCIPLDEAGNKFTEPPDEQVRACQQRLKEFIELADPKLIVCVGKLAHDWLDQGYRHALKLSKPVPLVQIVHPAAILRANVAARGLMIQRAVLALRNAVEEHCHAEGR